MKKKLTDAERFWSKVVGGDGCWIYSGSKKADGYGQFSVGSRADGTRGKVRAHRMAWCLTNGAIPDGMDVLHECDNPSCVRPDHLKLGTHIDNMKDARDRRRRQGASNANSQLSDAQVAEIRRRYESGLFTQTKLASQFGITQSMVSKIVRGENWSSRGQST